MALCICGRPMIQKNRVLRCDPCGYEYAEAQNGKIHLLGFQGGAKKAADFFKNIQAVIEGGGSCRG